MALKKVDILEQVQSELGSPEKRFAAVTKFSLDSMASLMESGNGHRVAGDGEFCVEDTRGQKQ